MKVSISRAAKELGVSITTLRRWEEAGKIICQQDLPRKEFHSRVPDHLEHIYGKYLVLPIRLPLHGQDNLAKAWFNSQAITYRLKARCFKLGIQVEVNPAYSRLIGLVKFMSLYGINSATAAARVIARTAMRLSERPPDRTTYHDMESRKHVWSNWRNVAKKVRGSSRHSFVNQPRLTACSRLRTDREISAVATINGLGEVGENPTGSCHTAGQRVCD